MDYGLCIANYSGVRTTPTRVPVSSYPTYVLQQSSASSISRSWPSFAILKRMVAAGLGDAAASYTTVEANPDTTPLGDWINGNTILHFGLPERSCPKPWAYFFTQGMAQSPPGSKPTLAMAALIVAWKLLLCQALKPSVSKP